MPPLRFAVYLAALCAMALPVHAEEATCPGNPAALGTSRVMTVGSDGMEVGLKTYPRTLALADHEVVLTFDDGPNARTTPKVLAALTHECVRATFFLIGRNAAGLPKLVKAEIAAGETVGHHSFSHPAVTERGLADAAARADIDRGFAADDAAGYGASGPEPRVPFFRFPGFGDTPALDSWLAGRGIAVFGADLWASDWLPMTPDEELTLLMGRLKAAGRGIILLHDIKEQTAAMLPAFLRALKADGFRVVHVVPGDGQTAVIDAPSGWQSETDKSAAEAAARASRPIRVQRASLNPRPTLRPQVTPPSLEQGPPPR